MTNPIDLVLHQIFEERNRKILFNKSHAKSIRFARQYDMDLLYNSILVGNIYKAKKEIHLQSNGGKMLIDHKVDSYKQHVWFVQKAITNLISIKNLIK